MLKIDPSQQAVSRQSSPEEFIVLILQHLVREMPDKVRGIPAHLQYGQIEVALVRARSHGLATDSQLIEFVSVMHEIAPNFDEEPTLKAMLDNGPGTPAERWESLFADTPEHAVAWERAAHPFFYDYKAWLAPEDR